VFRTSFCVRQIDAAGKPSSVMFRCVTCRSTKWAGQRLGTLKTLVGLDIGQYRNGQGSEAAKRHPHSEVLSLLLPYESTTARSSLPA